MYVHRGAPRKLRKDGGSYTVELPLALWMLLVCVGFPLIIMALITVRATFLSAAAKDAAHAAAKAKTFEAAVDGKPSAKQLAEAQAQETASKFGGVTLNEINTRIVITDAQDLSKAPEIRDNKLGQDETIDTSRYVYSVQVEVVGQVDPVVQFGLPLFGDVPGLNKPMDMRVAGIEMFENAQGLKE